MKKENLVSIFKALSLDINTFTNKIWKLNNFLVLYITAELFICIFL